MTQATGDDVISERRERAAPATVEVPDRRQLWHWVWASVRPVFGWLLAVLGAVALFLGWYGVSGQALTAKQLPYLVSGGLTGIALVILAAVVLATDDIRRELARVSELERKINDLYALFAADLAAPAPAAGSPPAPVGDGKHVFVALPAGSSFHRPDCALVANKRDVAAVDAATVRRRGLRPCRVCDPAPGS
ncbi:MAG: hypothetical protein QOF18_154 [Frankiaceae bacterium]|nr:hypothetical protein [Frankiaceae bacterium]